MFSRFCILVKLLFFILLMLMMIIMTPSNGKRLMMTMMVRGLGGRRPVTLTSPLPLPQALRGNKHNKECLTNKHNKECLSNKQNNENKTIHQAMFIKSVRWAPGPTLLLENKKVPRTFNWRWNRWNGQRYERCSNPFLASLFMFFGQWYCNTLTR